MKHLKDLFEAEFKNLYAMEKQIMADIENFPSVEHKKFNKALNLMAKSNGKNFEKIKKLNSDMSLNPGSTTDSIIQEILENIKSIESEKLNSKVKEAGLLASFNRLATYRTTAYFNAYRMARVGKMKSEAKAIKKMMKKSKDEAQRLMKCTKKSVFKEARA